MTIFITLFGNVIIFTLIYTKYRSKSELA